MLATKQATFTNDGQRLEINILAHKQWTKIGDQHFGAQAMDKDWKSTFWRTSNGQRLEINILVHKQWTKIGDQRFGAQGVARGCFRRSPFILFFISFISNCMHGFGVTFWR
jgi:hypothetical protein